MTKATVKNVQAYAGVAALCGVLAANFGMSQAEQNAIALFGFVYGALWINH